jgi:hypothetical protein
MHLAKMQDIFWDAVLQEKKLRYCKLVPIRYNFA